MKIQALVVSLLLVGCNTGILQLSQNDGLSKVRIQKLTKNEECTGKGMSYVSAENADRKYAIEDDTFFVSPGTWKISYIPERQVKAENGACKSVFTLCLHCQFVYDLKVRSNRSYFVFLNENNEPSAIE